MIIVATILSLILLLLAVLNFFDVFDKYQDIYWRVQAFGWNIVAALLWFLK